MKVENIDAAIKLLAELRASIHEIDHLRGGVKRMENGEGEGVELAVANNTKRITIFNREDILAINDAYINALCRVNDDIRTQLKKLGVTI